MYKRCLALRRHTRQGLILTIGAILNINKKGNFFKKRALKILNKEITYGNTDRSHHLGRKKTGKYNSFIKTYIIFNFSLFYYFHKILIQQVITFALVLEKYLDF